MNKTIVTFWGGPISYVERLSAQSILDAGHELLIFSYDDKKGFDEFSNYVVNAEDVIPKDDYIYKYYDVGRYNTFSNAFRAKLLLLGKGIWSDLDCIFLKYLDIEDELIVGFSNETKLNGNILYMEHNSPVLEKYAEATVNEKGRIPWATWRRRVRRDLQLLFGIKEPNIDQKTNRGPRALTYFINKGGMIGHASPIDYFNPIPCTKEAVEGLYLDCLDSEFEVLLGRSYVLHLWRGKLGRMHMLKYWPQENSFVGRLLRKHNIHNQQSLPVYEKK